MTIAKGKTRLQIEFTSRADGLLVHAVLRPDTGDKRKVSRLLSYFGQQIEKTPAQLAAEANLFCYDFCSKNGRPLETVEINRVFAIE